MVLKVWSHQLHIRACWKCQFLHPIPDLLNQKLWEGSPGICGGGLVFKLYLKERESVRVQAGERGRWRERERGEGRERLLSRLHAHHGTQCGAWSLDPGVVTWAEIKSWTFNRPSHPDALGMCVWTRPPGNSEAHLVSKSHGYRNTTR